MPKNVLELGPQIFAVLMGIITLLGGALAFAFRYRTRVLPGSSGHRPEEEQGDAELIGPDGYIDSFAGVIEEAGGGLPLVGKIIVAVIAVSYVVYLVLFWVAK